MVHHSPFTTHPLTYNTRRVMKKPGITVQFLSNGRSRTSLLRLPHSQMEYEAGRLQIRTEVRIRAPLSVVWHVVAGSMPEIWCVLPPLGKDE